MHLCCRVTTSMAERSRREVRKHGQKRASGALAQLAELRKGGKKHADLYELKEEADVYETMGEDEYAQFVSKRREEGGMPSSTRNWPSCIYNLFP